MKAINTPGVQERMKAFDALVQGERSLLEAKGHDYTAGKGNMDAYYNFRQVADMLEGAPITPYTVAMVYMLKHLFSLLTFAKTGRQESGEGLTGRHMDLRNYGFILHELVPDHLNHFEKVAVAVADQLERLTGMRREPAHISGHGHKWHEPELDEEDDDEGCWRNQVVEPAGLTQEILEEAAKLGKPKDEGTYWMDEPWLDKIEIEGKEVVPHHEAERQRLVAKRFNREAAELYNKVNAEVYGN